MRVVFALLALLLGGAAQAHGAGAAAPARTALAPATALERTAGPQDWVARVDGRAVPLRVALALQRLAARERPGIGLAEIVQALAQDLALGARAERERGDAELFDSARVGFDPAVQRHQEWLSSLRLLFGADYRAAAAPWRPTPAPDLAGFWALQLGLRLDDGLDGLQQQRARSLVLQRYDGACGHGAARLQAVTLADVWPRLDVQGRALLRRGERDFAVAQARNLVLERCFESWLREAGPWSEPELQFLADAVAARQRKLAWMRWLGLGDDPHAESHRLSELAAAVTADEVAALHAREPRRFERVDAVQALVLRCADAAAAEAAARELRQGGDVGSLRGVSEQRLDWSWPQPARDWLTALALTQSEQQLVGPVRSPEGDWVLLRIDQRRMGLHPADSETVRYQAAQQLAREQLALEWQQIQQQALGAQALVWHPGWAP